MIPYQDLCDAIERYRARLAGQEPPPAEAAPDAAGYADVEAGTTPAPVTQEITNEIDIDNVDVVE